MKKFFKFIFALIFLASLAGCVFFGYQYFKDSFNGNNLTIESAKELAYTVFYDTGIINEQEFKTALNKDPIIKPTNFMSDVDNTIEGTYFAVESTEEYSTYSDNNIYIVGSNNYLYEGSAWGYVSSIHFNNFNEQIFKVFENSLQEKTWYLVSDNKEYKFCYEIKGNKFIFRHISDAEYVFEFELLNKNSEGITDYSLIVRYLSGTSTKYLGGICKLDVGFSNNKKRVNRFINTDVGSTGWNVSYDCDIVNNKILYTRSTSAMKTQLLTNIQAYCHENTTQYYNSIDAIDMP